MCCENFLGFPAYEILSFKTFYERSDVGVKKWNIYFQREIDDKWCSSMDSKKGVDCFQDKYYVRIKNNQIIYTKLSFCVAFFIRYCTGNSQVFPRESTSMVVLLQQGFESWTLP